MVGECDDVTIDGKPTISCEFQLVMMNKRNGKLTARSDPYGRATVMDDLPTIYHYLNPIGRLDVDTTGLLLFTINGELNQRITHPSHSIPKVYMATLNKPFTHTGVFEQGVNIREARRATGIVLNIQQTIVHLEVKEGRNHVVKRMFASLGYKVTALSRTKVGHIELEGLEAGECMLLEKDEVERFLKT